MTSKKLTVENFRTDTTLGITLNTKLGNFTNRQNDSETKSQGQKMADLNYESFKTTRAKCKSERL